MTTHNCLEVFKFGVDMLGLSAEDRKNVVAKTIVARNYPFPRGSLTKKAPITTQEEVAVMLFFLVVMGGPLFWTLFSPICMVMFRASWSMWVCYTLATVALAFHPMPRTNSPDAPYVKAMRESWFTLALYKYFSYRFVWCDDHFEQCANSKTAWIGAGDWSLTRTAAIVLIFVPGVHLFRPAPWCFASRKPAKHAGKQFFCMPEICGCCCKCGVPHSILALHHFIWVGKLWHISVNDVSEFGLITMQCCRCFWKSHG